MGKTAFSGPLVVFGDRNPVGYGATGTNNANKGPGAMFGGNGFLDPRVGYNATRKGWVGIGTEYRRVLSATPATLGGANIAALANVVSGTAMTLAGASTGITVLGTGGLYVNGTGTTVPAGALVFDGNPTLVNYGLADSNGLYENNAYNITSLISRAVSVTGVSGGTGGDFLVRGYDVYGAAMSELITATSGATTVNGKKAFKFLASVTPQFTDAHNYSVGTTDIFGLPLRADFFHEVMIYWNSALLTASTGFVAAVTTTATTTTGDVRGTYAVQSASDGSKRLVFIMGPGQANIATTTGLFGVAQA